MSEAQPKPQSMTVIIGVIISGIIVGGIVTGFLIRRRNIRRRRETHPSSSRSQPHISDIEARRLSQIMTRERGPTPLSPVGSCYDNSSSQSGVRIMARLPSFESTHTSLTSTNPTSAHHIGHTSPSTFHGPLSTTTFSRTQSDPDITSENIIESDMPREGKSSKRLLERKERYHQRAKYRGQSLDAKIHQLPSWLTSQATIVALPRASMESMERLDKKMQEYSSPFMHEPGSSTGSLLLEKFPRKDGEWTEWSQEGEGGGTEVDGRYWGERRPRELRVTAGSIVETTEKAAASRVIRKKLLSLISSPSRPGTTHDFSREQKKYYWEMLHVHTDDSWWQLPFPPPLSPLNDSFQLPDLLSHSVSNPSLPDHHHPPNQQPPLTPPFPP
ncbi:hypothetical protein VP01_1922g1 [Puccinia sorghi]|uniref:Uncharacterized protein n=1 Tax=Puccinia sorghi TaxID=27349 RepID=A0A0L6VEF5_9BASI|nr:hypothetical protein VP01_1922g1 [Puccinia sorghi]